MDLVTLTCFVGAFGIALGIALRVAGRSWERKAATLAVLPPSGVRQLPAQSETMITAGRPALPAPPPPPPNRSEVLTINAAEEETMDDQEKQEAFERFKKMEDAFTESVYMVLCVSRSEENTRKFFEKCLKKAQQRWGEEHADEIMSALSDALTKSTAALSKEAEKKRRILEAS
jgi:hypothetical protein